MKHKLLPTIGLTLALGVGLALSPNTAEAYQLIGKVWTSTTSVKVPYAHSAGLPSTMHSAISLANQKWNSLSGSTLKTGALVVTSSVDVYSAAQLTVAYRDTEAAFGVYAPAVTSYVATGSNRAHIDFSNNWTWSTSFNKNAKIADTASVAVHEFGHAYGLNHMDAGPGPYSATQIAAVMNPNYQVKRTPNSDDIAGIAYLY